MKGIHRYDACHTPRPPKNPRGYHRFWRIMGYGWRGHDRYDTRPLSVRFINRKRKR